MNYLQCVVIEGWHKTGRSRSREQIKVLISFVMYTLEAKKMWRNRQHYKRWLNFCLSALSTSSPVLETVGVLHRNCLLISEWLVLVRSPVHFSPQESAKNIQMSKLSPRYVSFLSYWNNYKGMSNIWEQSSFGTELHRNTPVWNIKRFSHQFVPGWLGVVRAACASPFVQSILTKTYSRKPPTFHGQFLHLSICDFIQPSGFCIDFDSLSLSQWKFSSAVTRGRITLPSR